MKGLYVSCMWSCTGFLYSLIIIRLSIPCMYLREQRGRHEKELLHGTFFYVVIAIYHSIVHKQRVDISNLKDLLNLRCVRCILDKYRLKKVQVQT